MPNWCKNILLLFLSVALLSLSLAPVSQFYLAWIGLIPWLLLISRTRSKRSAFFWSWLGGILFFAANMWWLWKVTIPGMLALFVYLGLFWGIAGWIFLGCGLVSGGSAPLRVAANRAWSILLIAIVYTSLEWARGNWSMFGNQGLPWLYLGTSQSPLLIVCQIADTGGIYAVTFWVALMNALVFWIIIERKNITRVAPAIALVALFTAGVTLYGLMRMKHEPAGPGPVVVVIQPNYPQSNSGEKGASPEEILDFHVKTTRAALRDCTARGIKVDLIAWSETMMPPINRSAIEIERKYSNEKTYQNAVDALRQLSRESDATMLVGGAFADGWKSAGDQISAGDRRNSAYFFDRDGGMFSTRYDKIHLVPFGEFIPFDSIAFVHGLLMKLGPSGYENYVLTPGDLNKMPVFEIPRNDSVEWRFVTPICFEDLVGPLVAEMVRGPGGTKRAEFIVNLTNDGWFTASEMPQHFQAAVFRAIENRLPLARCVNTGISGFVDSIGRSHDIVPASTEGWNIAQLMLDDRVTFYTQHGDLLVEIGAAISALLIGAAIWNRKSGDLKEREI